MSENQPTASEKKPAKKKPNQRRDNQHGHRNHAESEQGGSQNRRHIPRHQQSHKVDMKKYEKMISDIHSNFSDIKSSNGAKDDCVICCKPCDIFGLGECRHPICIECCLRIRVLNGQKGCPVCRQELEVVSLLFASNGLETCSLDNQKHGHPAEDRFGIRFENKDVGERYEQYLAHVCKICKTPEGERLEFNTFNALRMHMSNAHQLTYCNICTENLNLFSRERKTYNRQNLQHHIREGDVDDKSQRGHPSCLFCEQRFFDTDGQYRHLRKDHFYCQFCEADGTMTNHFFGKHEELLKHYKAKHFLCEHESCRNVGIAFSTQVEFNLHKTQHSGKSMHLDFQYNDRQVIGHGRTRRDQGQRFQGGPNERIAVVPAEPVQQPPPRPNTEIIVVPSAQARNITIRYGRSSYSARQEDFPSLPGGLEGSTQSSAPQVVVPQQFPRLNKTGRAAAAAPKPQQPPKKPAEDFPSLGGRKGSQQQQQSSNWGQHTGNFEVIDDDERAASASRPQLPASVLAPPPKQQAVRQQTKVQPRKPPSPIPSEDFPSLPANAYTGLSSQTNWAAKAHGKSAITGLVMPKKKKLAQPDILPERSVTTPASSYQPVQETWEDIPYAKKLTVKQRRELQKKMEEARELQQEETMREIQEQMMVEPDEDLEMQAILMNDIASSSGVSSAESSRNNKKKEETVLREKNTSVEANNNRAKNNKKKEKKEPKPKEKLPDFPSLQSTTKKLDPKPPTPEPQQSTGLSWLLNSVSALTGLSLSNVLGTDHSLPLSSMPTEVARNTPTKEVAPPPGLSTPPTPTTAAPPPGLSFAPPPGFEHVTPPPGLPTPPDMFSSAPFLSHQDIAKPRAPSSQKQNSDGWSKKTKTK